MKVTIGGVTYNVDGTDDPVEAVKHAQEFAQQDLNKKAQTEYSDYDFENRLNVRIHSTLKALP